VTEALQLFLCGDVMTGRGIDQVLHHPGDPTLYEPWIHDARAYVDLARRKHGPIATPVEHAYPWGVALAELERMRPSFRIANLETSITTSADHFVDKAVHYRMEPLNIGCLTAARLDAVALANNHVLDWGRAGLAETLAALRAARVATAGAGADLDEARAPAVLTTNDGRVLLFSCATADSGVPPAWAASIGQPGIWRLPDASFEQARKVGEAVRARKCHGDVVVVSIHWGSNWGYEVPNQHREFAHALVESYGVDVVHGHSSHHPRPFEVHRGKLILYGCGDFIDDYEGISGHEAYRGDLVVMYFVTLDPSGSLAQLQLVPLQTRQFRLQYASPPDTAWLASALTRECRRFEVRIDRTDTALVARWRG